MTAAFFFSIVANDFARFAFLRQIWLQGNDWRLYSVLWIVSVMVKNCFCTHDAAWPLLECKERDRMMSSWLEVSLCSSGS